MLQYYTSSMIQIALLAPESYGSVDLSLGFLVSALAVIAHTRHNNPLVDVVGSPSLEAGFGL